MRGNRLGALVLLIATAACAPRSGPAGGPGTSPPIGVARLADGLEVYKSQYCGFCHVLGTAESSGSTGPTHDGIGTTAAQRVLDERYTGAATTAERYLRESIVAPAAYVVPGYEHTRYRMPAYINLSEADLAAVVQLLLQED